MTQLFRDMVLPKNVKNKQTDKIKLKKVTDIKGTEWCCRTSKVDFIAYSAPRTAEVD